ncbi:hypothetical protein BJY00DRAFT_288753 [Aspergillus carlsbadensis]|nr:hypothetical protein BJY00DRAFT_288753 [Aspergillus carlsbadensis]
MHVPRPGQVHTRGATCNPLIEAILPDLIHWPAKDESIDRVGARCLAAQPSTWLVSIAPRSPIARLSYLRRHSPLTPTSHLESLVRSLTRGWSHVWMSYPLLVCWEAVTLGVPWLLVSLPLAPTETSTIGCDITAYLSWRVTIGYAQSISLSCAVGGVILSPFDAIILRDFGCWISSGSEFVCAVRLIA